MHATNFAVVMVPVYGIMAFAPRSKLVGGALPLGWLAMHASDDGLSSG